MTIMSVTYPRVLFLAGCLFVSMSGCSADEAIDNETPDPTRLTELETENRSGLASPDDTLLGLKLNSRLSLPSCDDVIKTETTCISDGDVYLSEAERPKFLRFESFDVEVNLNGELQSVALSFEPEYAKHVRELLEIKYGKPDYSIEQLRNFPTHSWTYVDMQVLLLAYSDVKAIIIRTTANRLEEEARSKADRAVKDAEEARRRSL